MSFCVYVLQSGAEKYVGVTKNIADRIMRHNTGQNRSTKHCKNWKVIYFERYGTLGEAKIEERRIKSIGTKNLLYRDVAQPG